MLNEVSEGGGGKRVAEGNEKTNKCELMRGSSPQLIVEYGELLHNLVCFCFKSKRLLAKTVQTFQRRF